MASSWTHAAFAIGTAACLTPAPVPKYLWRLTAVAAALPDIDALGRPLGTGDVGWLGGHRAFTHSLFFAFAAGALLAAAMRVPGTGRAYRARLTLALTVAIATHGMLDSLTSYGEGIEFFSPLSFIRFHAPWRPLGTSIVRDSVLFALSAGVAYVVMVRRRFVAAPRWLRLS